MPQLDARREDTAKTGEERLRLLVEQIADYAIFILDSSGRVSTWNAGAQRLKGYSASEIIGKHYSIFYRKQDAWKGEGLLDAAAREGAVEDEGWRVRKDGTAFWANVTTTALRDSQGRVVGFGKVTRDLTERRKTEDAIRQSEERLRLFVESVSEYAILLLDPRGMVATWNRGAERINGYRAEEIIGRHFSRFYPEEDVRSGNCDGYLEAAVRDGRFEEEVWRIRKDGDRFWAHLTITALRDSRGNLVGFATVTRDLTERRRAEEDRLRLAEQASARASAERVVTLLTRLHEVASSLSAARTREEVARVVLRECASALGSSSGAFFLRNGADLEVLTSFGDRMFDLRGDATGSAVREAYRSATPQWPERLNAPVGAPTKLPVASAGATVGLPLTGDATVLSGATVALPLTIDGPVLGVAAFQCEAPSALSDEVRALVQAMVTYASQAFDRANAYEREHAARVHAEALQASLSTTLRSIGDAVMTIDDRARVTLMNPVAEVLTGWSESEAGALPVDRVFHVDSEEGGRSAIVTALRKGQALVSERAVLRSERGPERPIAATASPIRRPDGTLLGAVLVFRDVTRERFWLLRREFLVKAGEAFVSSLDYATTLETIARLSVPDLADWSAVHVVASGESAPALMAVAHADPAQEHLARELAAGPLSMLPMRVMRTGNSELHTEASELGAESADLRRIIQETRIDSAIVVPMSGRGESLGALTLLYTGSGRRHTESDRAFAEEFARRAAMAVENARALQQVKDAVRAREDLLAMVSHDLRNPLSTVLMGARIIEQRADTSDSGTRIAKAAANIVKAVGRMSRLVGDLLDLAKLEAGKPLSIEVEENDLGNLIREVAEQLAPVAQARLLKVSTDVSGPIRVRLDAQRVMQVLSNLVENAIKHTREGGAIELGAKRTEREAIAWVRDTGTGISADQIPRIFEPYWQANANRKGGLGLGLPIVKAIVQAHGGRVWVQSSVGTGSTFSFALPACDDGSRG